MATPGAPRSLLVIGASAGGVSAICELMRGLPADLPAAVITVLHVSPYSPGTLPVIFGRCGKLPVSHPSDGERLRPGHFYIAPPDHHVVVENGTLRLSRGPSENGFRPAIDVLFRSAARSYGPRVVAVVLTGNLDDGTAGLAEVKRRGGTAVAQDPYDADFPSMPSSAIRNVDVDHVRPLLDLPALLTRLSVAAAETVEPVEQAAAGRGETAAMKEELDRGEDREPGAAPSGFSCPLCSGVLWQDEQGNYQHYRCRTGHAFSPESLFALQSKGVESVLWVALRALEENAALARRMAEQAMNAQPAGEQERYRRRQAEAERDAEVMREMLMKPEAAGSPAS